MFNDRITWICVLPLIVLMSCTSIKHVATESDLVIKLGVGTEKIKLGSITRREVTRLYGKGDRNIGTFSFSNHHIDYNYYTYEDIGFEVRYADEFNMRKKDTLQSLIVTQTSKARLENGIGIGTTKSVVDSLMGLPKSLVFETLLDGSIVHTSTYSNVKFYFGGLTSTNEDPLKAIVVKLKVWKE